MDCTKRITQYNRVQENPYHYHVHNMWATSICMNVFKNKSVHKLPILRFQHRFVGPANPLYKLKLTIYFQDPHINLVYIHFVLFIQREYLDGEHKSDYIRCIVVIINLWDIWQVILDIVSSIAQFVANLRSH